MEIFEEMNEINNIYQELKNQLVHTKDSKILLSCIENDKGSIKELEKQIDHHFLTYKERQELLLNGKPMCITHEGKLYFAEPFYKKERILIFGGGHVALPLVKLAKIVGFYVVIADDREEFANKERFPEADEVYHGSYESCMAKMKPTISDYCVIITRGHQQDSLCIRELFQYEEPIYTGLIGSRKRTKIVFEKLAKEGLSKKRLEHICTPIGLPIGAQTTEEIGISIMAEIIQRKRIESKDSLVVNRSDLDHDALELLSLASGKLAVATIMEATGSVPRKAGAKMLIYPDKSIMGTIGGGKVEAAVIEKAQKIIDSKTYEILTVQLNGEDAMAEGMVCGGSLKILLEDVN